MQVRHAQRCPDARPSQRWIEVASTQRSAVLVRKQEAVRPRTANSAICSVTFGRIPRGNDTIRTPARDLGGPISSPPRTFTNCRRTRTVHPSVSMSARVSAVISLPKPPNGAQTADVTHVSRPCLGRPIGPQQAVRLWGTSSPRLRLLSGKGAIVAAMQRPSDDVRTVLDQFDVAASRVRRSARITGRRRTPTGPRHGSPTLASLKIKWPRCARPAARVLAPLRAPPEPPWRAPSSPLTSIKRGDMVAELKTFDRRGSHHDRLATSTPDHRSARRRTRPRARQSR